jgi:hypothetical protein
LRSYSLRSLPSRDLRYRYSRRRRALRRSIFVREKWETSSLSLSFFRSLVLSSLAQRALATTRGDTC